MEPEDDYEFLLDILDEGRLPVVAFTPDPCLRVFRIEDWSPVVTGTPRQRELCVLTLIAHVHQQDEQDHADL
jgi:hypothetical protein